MACSGRFAHNSFAPHYYSMNSVSEHIFLTSHVDTWYFLGPFQIKQFVADMRGVVLRSVPPNFEESNFSPFICTKVGTYYVIMIPRYKHKHSG